MKEKQLRMTTNNLEVRMNNEENSMILEGYAATYDNPTVLYEIDGIQYNEVIDRGAFDEMDFKDCCLKYNHSNNVPILARTRGGSLELILDDIGLRFKANLFNTSGSKANPFSLEDRASPLNFNKTLLYFICNTPF